MRRYHHYSILAIIIALIWYFFTHTSTFSQITHPSPSPLPTIQISHAPGYATVKRAIDGDTIEISTGQKVRYIGMDTPELHHPKKPVQCFAQKAYERNRELIEGKTVRLEKDVSETDKYGRLLRYVFIDDPQASPSSLFINDVLVKEGYAHSATFPPDVKYQEQFLQSQREAMENDRGLWKECK